MSTYRRRNIDPQCRETGVNLILRGFHFGNGVEDDFNEFKTKQYQLTNQLNDLKQLEESDAKKALIKRCENNIKANLTLRDTICYNIATAIEVLVKGMCSYYGQNYVENHFIRKNIEILENQIRFNRELNEIRDILNDMLINLSVTISQWVNIARYTTITPDDYNSETEDDLMNSIDSVINYFNTLSNFIRRHDLDQYD